MEDENVPGTALNTDFGIFFVLSLKTRDIKEHKRRVLRQGYSSMTKKKSAQRAGARGGSPDDSTQYRCDIFCLTTFFLCTCGQ